MSQIAISGIEALFPDAQDVGEYWSDISQKNYCLKEILDNMVFIGFFRPNFLSRRIQPIKAPTGNHLPIGNIIEERALRLVEYIQSHYQNPDLTVKQIGHEVGILPSCITGILLQKFKIRFKAYLNFVRIEESKHLLNRTDRTICEIAFAVGYNSIPHFNRVFRAAVGVSPRSYREKCRIATS
jgi:AraC-like DNA-binding protein